MPWLVAVARHYSEKERYVSKLSRLDPHVGHSDMDPEP